MKRKRSYRSVWVRQNFPDVKINICLSIQKHFVCTKVFQTCATARLTSLSLLPGTVAWPAERRAEEHGDEDVGRMSLYCPS